MTENEIQDFLSDPETKDISDKVLQPKCHLSAMSNGKIIRLWDGYGWEEYFKFEDLMGLIERRGKIPSISKIHWLNDIEEIDVEDEY